MKYIYLTTLLLLSLNSNAQCLADVSAVFTGNPMNPNEVEFNNLSQAPAGSYFILTTGDGNTYTLGPNVFPTPIYHTYLMAGTYTYCIYIVDTISSCNASFCDDITISNTVATCDASFSSNDTVTSYTEIQFYSTGFNTVQVNHFWDFGNGITSQLADPVVDFLVNGSYYVCHTVSDVNSQCSDTYCDSVVISNSGSGSVPCNSSFYWYEDTSTSHTVSIINTSTGSQLSYFWDFGDGSTSTDPYPTHTYNSLGSFYVCLTVSSNPILNSCTSTFCDSVYVTFKGGGFTINVYSAAVASLSESIAAELLLFPNPASDYLFIQYPESGEPLTYSIRSVNGQLIRTDQLDPQGIISISELKEGLYFLDFTGHEPLRFQKID